MNADELKNNYSERVRRWRGQSSLRNRLGLVLLCVGCAGAVGAFSTYYLLWSGHLQLLASLADALHAGLYVGPLLVIVFLASIGLALSGIVVGAARFCLKRLP